jgi:CheY-like chemotaxis protein
MNKKILLVDDDEDLRVIFQSILGSEGYIVETANNGQEALDQLRASTTLPALIILDIIMPVMDGLQFRQEQALDPRLANIPVVVSTAGGNFEGKRPMTGVKAVLKKPLDVETFIDTLKQQIVF